MADLDHALRTSQRLIEDEALSILNNLRSDIRRLKHRFSDNYWDDLVFPDDSFPIIRECPKEDVTLSNLELISEGLTFLTQNLQDLDILTEHLKNGQTATP